MKENLTIVKVGGKIVEEEASLQKLLEEFTAVEGLKVLIHGGGRTATALAAKMGIETRMVDGRRITDEDMLRVVTMVYAGWINKSIVAALQHNGCNAIGLSGADANVIPSTRRSPIPIDFGYVGGPLPDKVNNTFISQLIDSGITPVFCAITHDGKGTLLNTNADTIANTVATAMSAQYTTTLYYCFEMDGVLSDINNPNSIIPTLTQSEAEACKADGTIAGGMITKIDNAFNAINQGVEEVLILHAKNLLQKKGTLLIKNN